MQLVFEDILKPPDINTVSRVYEECRCRREKNLTARHLIQASIQGRTTYEHVRQRVQDGLDRLECRIGYVKISEEIKRFLFRGRNLFDKAIRFQPFAYLALVNNKCNSLGLVTVRIRLELFSDSISGPYWLEMRNKSRLVERVHTVDYSVTGLDDADTWNENDLVNRECFLDLVIFLLFKVLLDGIINTSDIVIVTNRKLLLFRSEFSRNGMKSH